MNLLSNKKKRAFASCWVGILWALVWPLNPLWAQNTPPKNLPVPPNTVWLQDSFFVDKTEIANLHWLEYLHYLKQGVSKNLITQNFYNDQVPDSSICQTERGNLVTHPAYRYQPVVGVSYAQARNFCKWRSAVVTELYNQENPAPEGTHWQFTFRLPTIEEWEKAAKGGLDVSLYPHGLKKWYKIEAEAPVRMRPPDPLVNYRNHKSKTFTLKKITEYPPNALGLHQMIGNVAEMTATEGVAKGGSWRHRKEACKIRRQQRYFLPDNWLGFRCVCEVKLVNTPYHSTRDVFWFR